MRDRCQALGLQYIFKASYDKANRSSIHSRRGHGLEAGLDMIAEVAGELGVPCTTDVHEPGHCAVAARYVDLLQIPAFLCRQTDLLVAAAQSGKPVNVKKGQFLSPAEMKQVVAKLTEAEAAGIMLTERGTFFGYHRLVNDFAGLVDLMAMGHPVCFDATHSTQRPGGEGTQSGGDPAKAAPLAKAAIAVGVQAVFIEAHPEPSQGWSDAATMLPLPEAVGLLGSLAKLREAAEG